MFLRFQMTDDLDAAVVDAAVAPGERVTLQTSEIPPTARTLARLDALAAKHGSAVDVRFYGGLQHFDGRILKRLPNVRSLTVDCFASAGDLETLASL